MDARLARLGQAARRLTLVPEFLRFADPSRIMTAHQERVWDIETLANCSTGKPVA